MVSSEARLRFDDDNDEDEGAKGAAWSVCVRFKARTAAPHCSRATNFWTTACRWTGGAILRESDGRGGGGGDCDCDCDDC